MLYEKSVTYSSTRGGQTNLDFRTVVMTGLAHDRGLFVPDTMPIVTVQKLEEWKDLGYSDLAVNVIRKFVKDDQVPLAKLQDIVKRSCDAFRHEEVTPVVKVGDHYIMELFHGPTFAFKDVALQMLGNFFEYFLDTGSNGGRLAVLGATSGDTGSAAIYGLRGKHGVDCIILFPNGRVSEIQERQMTTVTDSNIHCVAVDGTFDDCQDIVKASFNNQEFRSKVHLGAVNSINWCRVLAQTTYYFWSYLQLKKANPSIDTVNYSVPTGNFGDILAGYYAKQMGLPVGKLVVATNENDILHRFFQDGKYHRYDIQHTISPSMDICVSSNFERYLYEVAGRDPVKLEKWMNDFEQTKKLTLVGEELKRAQADFASARADTDATLAVIKEYNDKYGYVLCPHSAVGVAAIEQLNMQNGETVCLATAHYDKFPAAVSRAVDPLPTPPPELASLALLETRRTCLPNDTKAVQDFVEQVIADRLAKEKKRSTLKTVVLTTALAGVVAVVVQAVFKKRSSS
jgi:threonine synthase